MMEASPEDMRIYNDIAAQHPEVRRKLFQVDPQPSIDCRTCFNAASHSCTSSVECDAGSQYRPRRPLQLWRGA